MDEWKTNIETCVPFDLLSVSWLLMQNAREAADVCHSLTKIQQLGLQSVQEESSNAEKMSLQPFRRPAMK